MRFWGTLIITLGSVAIYEDLILKTIRLFQRIGLIDKQHLFSAENGFEYTYLESARVWALILLIVFLLCLTILYYKKRHEFFWNKIINP